MATEIDNLPKYIAIFLMSSERRMPNEEKLYLTFALHKGITIRQGIKTNSKMSTQSSVMAYEQKKEWKLCKKINR